MPETETRKCLIGHDLQQIERIEKLCFVESCQWTRREIKEFMRLKSSRCMVSESSGNIVGFVFYRIGERTHQVWHIAVHPDFRRRSIGSDLLAGVWNEMCRGSLRQQSISCIVPETEVDTLGFFAALQFKAVAITMPIDSPVDCVVMRVDSVLESSFSNRLEKYFVQSAMEW
jgi:ribosomal protein S18 acetylase RimI-like enzyme